MARLIFILTIVLAPVRWVYVVDKAKCNGCGNCTYACTEGAISIMGGDAWIDPELCNGCGTCVSYCPRDAIFREWYTGISESGSDEGLRLQSNPVSSGSAVLLGAEQDLEIFLMDASGRTVMKTEADAEGTAVFDLSNLPRGSYRIAAGEEIVTLSLI